MKSRKFWVQKIRAQPTQMSQIQTLRTLLPVFIKIIVIWARAEKEIRLYLISYACAICGKGSEDTIFGYASYVKAVGNLGYIVRAYF